MNEYGKDETGKDKTEEIDLKMPEFEKEETEETETAPKITTKDIPWREISFTLGGFCAALIIAVIVLSVSLAGSNEEGKVTVIERTEQSVVTEAEERSKEETSQKPSNESKETQEAVAHTSDEEEKQTEIFGATVDKMTRDQYESLLSHNPSKASLPVYKNFVENGVEYVYLGASEVSVTISGEGGKPLDAFVSDVNGFFKIYVPISKTYSLYGKKSNSTYFPVVWSGGAIRAGEHNEIYMVATQQ